MYIHKRLKFVMVAEAKIEVLHLKGELTTEGVGVSIIFPLYTNK